jgi:hypothetical protein
LATHYHDARTQIIYQAGEIGGPRNIIALGLYVADTPGQIANSFTIRLKHTDLTVYGSSPNWETSGWTTVYQANEDITEKTGWVQFYFSAPFIYNGVQNLIVDISFNNSSYDTPGYCRYSLPGGMRTIYYMSDSHNGDPLTWSDRSPIPSISTRVPNIKFVTTALIGDLNGTVGVDWQDLTLFVSYWLRTDCADPYWCGKADFNKSGNIDLTDFAIMAQHWLEGNVQYPPYDIVPDGKINIDDLLVLIEQWLSAPGTPSADIAPQPLDNVVNIEDFALLAQHWLEGT